MTSRAGQAHPVYAGGPPCSPACPGVWSDYHDGYSDGFERAEQEVRDDIRALADTVKMPHSFAGDATLAGAWLAGKQAVLAAISSSSATENRHESATPVVTQDGEPEPCDCRLHAPERFETQDGERPWEHPYEGSPEYPDRCRHCGLVGSYAHTEEFYRKWVGPSGFRFTDLTPTPTPDMGRDDRGREVERIAAVLRKMGAEVVVYNNIPADMDERATRSALLLDAGLRASGGTEG